MSFGGETNFELDFIIPHNFWRVSKKARQSERIGTCNEITIINSSCIIFISLIDKRREKSHIIMNVTGSSRSSLRNPLRRGGNLNGDKLDNNNSSTTNNLELNFYATPPNYELSIDEFESLALARLKVRIFIESRIIHY